MALSGNVIDFDEHRGMIGRLENPSARGHIGGSGPTGPGGGMGNLTERVAKLEMGVEHVRQDIGLVRSDVKEFRSEMMGALKDLRADIKKLPDEWVMAKVVFYVVGALGAAAIIGPRILAMLPGAGAP